MVGDTLAKGMEFGGSSAIISRGGDFLGQLLRNRKGAIGVTILIPILSVSILAPVLAPYDPTAIHAADRFADPGSSYLFGTDTYGRDILSRVLFGGRSTLMLGIIATLLGLLAGVPIGIISGYLGGRIDEVIMRLMDGLLSIPSLLLALLVVAMLGSSIWNAILAIAIVFTPRLARITRSSTLSIKNEEFVKAAEARGESMAYIAFREILPNAMPAIVVEGSIRIGFGILIGTSLSFLGLGAQPPEPDWGYMIAKAINTMSESPWPMLWPSLALGLTIMGFNLLGDGLRDVLDPEVEDST